MGYMETATLWLLSAGSPHLQQAEPIAGEGGRDFHHAGTGGCPDERHDAEVIHVLGNDIAVVHFTVGTELLESLGRCRSSLLALPETGRKRVG